MKLLMTKSGYFVALPGHDVAIPYVLGFYGLFGPCTTVERAWFALLAVIQMCSRWVLAALLHRFCS